MRFGAHEMSEAARESARLEYGERTSLIRRIAASYPLVVRAYCLVRFTIIRARILGVMDVLLPERGRILELGCGFGLFAGYFSLQAPARSLLGFDRDAKRIAMARHMAERLGAPARFEEADIRDLPPSDT